jgi:recombination associated protein RdgC
MQMAYCEPVNGHSSNKGVSFMSLLSSAVSITRYRVTGQMEDPITDAVYRGLKNNMLPEIDDIESAQSVGWTSFQDPFTPSFEGSSFAYGNYFVFSLRLDKKTIPSKLVQKYMAIEITKKLQATGREFLSKNEKKMIKDNVISLLGLRIPATPNIYNVLWNYEASLIWFFTHLKGPNEELETLFKTSFGLTLTRIFPFTFAESCPGMAGFDLDILTTLSPTKMLR